MHDDFVFVVWDIMHRAPQLCGPCWLKSNGSQPACNYLSHYSTSAASPSLPPSSNCRTMLKSLCSHPLGYKLSPYTLSSSPSCILASYSAEWWGHWPHPTDLLTPGKWSKTMQRCNNPPHAEAGGGGTALQLLLRIGSLLIKAKPPPIGLMNKSNVWTLTPCGSLKQTLVQYGEKLYYRSFTNRKDANSVFWNKSFGSYWAKANIHLLRSPKGLIYWKLTVKKGFKKSRGIIKNRRWNEKKQERMRKARKSTLETKVA